MPRVWASLGKVTIHIPDDVEQVVRMEAVKDGYHKGEISRIVTKALIDYIPELREKYSGLEKNSGEQ